MTDIDKLAAALAKAQGEFKPVQKTGRNPHLRNEYATLDDIISAVRPALCKYGLSFVQLLGNDGAGMTTLNTILMHESGQRLEADVTVDSSEQRGINALQSLGAAITYMKRYSLSAMLGIAADVDSDGEGTTAQAKSKAETAKVEGQPKPEPPKANGKSFDQKDLRDAMEKLLILANEATANHYKGTAHLYKTLQQERGKDFSWGNPNDTELWAGYLSTLIGHVQNKQEGLPL